MSEVKIRPTPIEPHNKASGLREAAMLLLEDQAFISYASLARALGCSYWTVYEWARNDKEFGDRFKIARQKAVDEVKEVAVLRANSESKPSDLMSIYIMNNFDEEIVERLNKQRGAEIIIRLEVPSAPASIDSWAREVAALPAPTTTYKEVSEQPLIESEASA